MRYKILDWKKALEKDKKSMERWRDSEKKVPERLIRQDAVVKEPIKLPRVKKTDTVMVFAGSTGEISSGIKGPKIIHSDADSRRVRIAKKRFGEKYEGVLVADAVSLPTAKVDWLFSFEPSPLMNRPYFVPRAIASSKKGFIISRRPMFYTFRNLRRVAQMYGIAPKEVSRRLLSADVYDGKGTNRLEKRRIGFVVFEADGRAKRLASIDNTVIEKLSMKARRGKISDKDVEKLRRELGITRDEMRGSFERINEMVSLKLKNVMFRGRTPKHLDLPHVDVDY